MNYWLFGAFARLVWNREVIMLPVMVFVLMAIACWSALGCDALREFSYSRLEELCTKRGVADRFGRILKRQGEALLALEFLLTMSTLGLATILCCWIGWPKMDVENSVDGGAFQVILKYAFFALLAFVAADLLPWTIARVVSESFLFTYWPVIEGLQTVLSPLLWVATLLDRYAKRLAGRTDLEADDTSKIEEEIRSVVEEGEREGVLESGHGHDSASHATSRRRRWGDHDAADRDGLCQC